MNTNAFSNLMDREGSGMLKRETGNPLQKNTFRNGLLKSLLMLSLILVMGLNVRSQDLTTDLALHLPFNETINDAGPNSLTTTNVGGAVFSSDRFNYQDSALSFDGVDDKISVTNSAELQTGTYFSVAFWFKTTKTTNQWIVVKGDGSAYETRYQMNMNPDGTLVFVITAATTYKYASSSGGFNDGNWHFVVARKYLNSGNTIEIDLWVDNVFQSTTNTGYPTYSADNADPLSLGSFAANTADRFLGSLDDFRLYKKKLSDQEITALFTLKPKELNAAPQLTSSLPSSIDLNEGYPPYTLMDLDNHFDDPDGTPLLFTVTSANSGLLEASLENRKLVLLPVYDSTGTTMLTIQATDYTDTISQTITINVNPVTGPDLKKGLFAYYPFNGNTEDESGFGFNASNSTTLSVDRFNIPNRSSYGRVIVDDFKLQSTEELSVSFWMRSNYTLNSTPGANSSSYIFMEHSNSFIARAASGLFISGNSSQGSTSINWPGNTWYHIVVTGKKGGELNLYTDTVKSKLRDLDAFFSILPQDLGIGGNPVNGTGALFGLMDDIRFYRRELSLDEIKLLYEEVKENEDPVLQFENKEIHLNEDSVYQVDLDAVYLDPESIDVSFSVTNSNGGSLTELLTGDILRVTPEADYFGTDTLFIELSDGINTVNDTLLLVFDPVNDEPAFTLSDVRVSVPYFFEGPEEVLNISSFDQPANESSQPISYSISPSSIPFADFSFDTTTGVFTLNSVTGVKGSQIFTITAQDGEVSNNSFSDEFKFEVMIVEIDTGLFTHYGFNGNTRDRMGISGNLGFYYGNSPGLVADRFGQDTAAYNFNYSVLRLSNFDNSAIADGYSVSFWMKPITEMEPASARRVIYDHRGTRSILLYEAGQLKFVLNSTNTTFTKDTFFLADQWYHIAVTAEAGGKVRFHIDGTDFVVGDAPASFDQGAQSIFVGGTTNTLTNHGTDYGYLALDDLRFYGRALNYMEIDSLYHFPEQEFVNTTGAICQGDTLHRGGTLIFEAGYHYYSLPGGASPDTLVELNLTINARPMVKATAPLLKVCEGAEVSLSGLGALSYTWDKGIENATPFLISDTATYTVIGTDMNGCKDTAEITITVVPDPISDDLLSAVQTAFCGADSAFTTVSVDSSVVNINYYLRNDADNSIIRGPVPGTGSALDFQTDTVYTTTVYNVYAVKAPGTTSSLDFDGVNDKVTIPYHASMDVTDRFTIEAWIYPRSANYDRFISNFSGSASTPGDIVLDGYATPDNGRGLRFLMTFPGTPNVYKSISAVNVLNLNEWNHIAAVFDKGAMILYANGSQVATGSFGMETVPVNTANFVLGEDNGGTVGEYLNGKMDDVRFWNISRTEDDIRAAMNVELTGFETGLFAYYRFDEGTGTVLTDYSQNSNNGTLVNMNEFTDWVDGKVSGEVICSRELSQKITLSIDQAIIIASENDTIMLGDSIEISAAGGTYYTWDNGLGEGQSHTVSPDVTTTYTVTGSNGDCSNTDEVTIFVIPVPQLVNPIADITLSEDEDLMGIASLDTVFTEPSGGELTFSALSSDPGVEVTINENVISLFTLQDFHGNANITVVAENTNGSSTDEFSVTVNPVNDRPVLSLDREEVNVLENFSGSEIITAQISQPANEEGQDISYTLIPGSVNFASVVLDSTGTITIQAVADSTGTQEFMVIADDMQPENNTDTAVFVLTVSSVPAPFVENPFSDLSFDEDMVTLSGLDLNDVFSHPAHATLTFTAASDNPNLNASISGSLLALSAIPDYFGSGTVTLTASDGSYQASDEFMVSINPVNDKPLLTLSKSEVSVLKNFESIQTVTSTVSQPANEASQSLSFELIPDTLPFVSLSIDALGMVSIGAVTDSSGTAELMIVVNDGETTNSSDTALFVLNVTSVPVPVVENPIADQVFDEDEVSFSIADLKSVFSHPASAALSFSGLSNNEDVIVTVSGNSLTLTASPDYFGTALITVTASDGSFSASDEFNLNISPVNDAPVFSLSKTLLNLEIGIIDPIIISVIPEFTANESDQTVTYTIDPPGVTFAGIAFNSATGELEIIPIFGETASQIFTVIANDGQIENNLYSQTFELNISANMAPVVVNPVQDINIDEDLGPIVVLSDITLVFNDPENDELSYSVSSDNASVVPVLQGNSLVIELAADYSGTASLILSANDGVHVSDDEFTVNVIPVNDPPVFELSQIAQTLSVNFLDPSIITVNSLQPENESGQVITYSLTPAFVEFAFVSIDPTTGTLTVEPVQNASGSQVFTVMANDGQSKNNLFSQEFSLSVVNDNPSDIVLSSADIAENMVAGTFLGFLAATDDNQVNPVYSLVAGEGDTDNLSFSITGNQLLTHTVLNFESKSSLSVRIRVEDGLGGELEKAIVINVLDRNDAPTVVNLSNNVVKEDQLPGTAIGLFTVQDEDEGEFSGTYVYSFDTGNGIVDADNLNFSIEGSVLLLNSTLDFAVKPLHFIFMKADDGQENGSINGAFVIEVTKADPTGISVAELYHLKTYPNPSSGLFTLEFPEKVEKEMIIRVYDLKGTLLINIPVLQGSRSLSLDLSNQKPGTYLMKVNVSGHDFIHTLVRK